MEDKELLELIYFEILSKKTEEEIERELEKISEKLWESIYPRIENINEEGLEMWLRDIERQRAGSIEPFRDILDRIPLVSSVPEIQYMVVGIIFQTAIFRCRMQKSGPRVRVLTRKMIDLATK